MGSISPVPPDFSPLAKKGKVGGGVKKNPLSSSSLSSTPAYFLAPAAELAWAGELPQAAVQINHTPTRVSVGASRPPSAADA